MSIIPFEQPHEPQYLEDMSRRELEDYLTQLRQRLRELDAREPKKIHSEEYEAWADEHEELEDAIDEVLEFLDEA